METQLHVQHILSYTGLAAAWIIIGICLLESFDDYLTWRKRDRDEGWEILGTIFFIGTWILLIISGVFFLSEVNSNRLGLRLLWTVFGVGVSTLFLTFFFTRVKLGDFLLPAGVRLYGSASLMVLMSIGMCWLGWSESAIQLLSPLG